MVDKEVGDAVGGLNKLCPTGTSVLVEGTLAQTPEGTKQVRAWALHDASPGVGAKPPRDLPTILPAPPTQPSPAAPCRPWS